MSRAIEVKVPDIGDFKDVPVIEVLVKPGDTVKAEDPLLTLESDKATMDVPSPAAGVVRELRVKIGDKVSEGVVVMTLEAAAGDAQTAEPPRAAAAPETAAAAPPAQVAPAAPAAVEFPSVPPARKGVGSSEEPVQPLVSPPPPSPADIAAAVAGGHKAHASPSIRRFARELGVDVAQVKGSGPKGRIVREDVQAYVKGALARAAGGFRQVRPRRGEAAGAHQEALGGKPGA